MEHVVIVLLAALATVVHGSGVAPLRRLHDGRSIPAIGLGTFLGIVTDDVVREPKGTEVQDAVGWAIDAGYRHFDTSITYKTEPQLGIGINKKIADGTVRREDIFVTTKLWSDKHAKEAVAPALRESLRNLNLDYVDLFLIHFPIGLFENGTYDNTDYLETWQGMMEVVDLGWAKSIGVSNFNQTMLERMVATGNAPAALEVEISLNLQQPELLAYCQSQNIPVIGYTPFGSLFYKKATPSSPPPRVDDPVLVAIAEKYNKTVPQVNLRYLISLGVIPIPKSTNKSHIEENIDVFDFELSDEDKKTLRSFDRGYRTFPVKKWEDSPLYPFERN